MTVKCVVWDLDNTLWDGVLLERDRVRLHDWVPGVMETLDRRGILSSIASRNDPAAGEARLREAGIWQYFVYPQIGWGTKSAAIQRIARQLNIGLDTLALIDDDSFEHAEVSFQLPMVRHIDPSLGAAIARLPELIPAQVTGEAAQRRSLYQSEAVRQHAETAFEGTSQEFLATLDLRLTISAAEEADLDRAAELSVRTNQLNSTGITYSRAQLAALLHSDRHRLLVIDLTDRFGGYGKIGLALLECDSDSWTIRLLLMSCRVASRGVGAVVLNRLCALARARGVRLLADFRRNERNRLMYMTYKFGGFTETAADGNQITFEADLRRAVPLPSYVTVAYRNLSVGESGFDRDPEAAQPAQP